MKNFIRVIVSLITIITIIMAVAGCVKHNQPTAKNTDTDSTESTDVSETAVFGSENIVTLKNPNAVVEVKEDYTDASGDTVHAAPPPTTTNPEKVDIKTLPETTPKPHTHKYSVVDTKTSTQNGNKVTVTTYKCSCGHTYEDKKSEPIIENHTHSYTSKVTKTATCSADGEKTYTCKCGSSYIEKIPATGHNFNNSVITKKATCTANGVKTFSCKCGASYTEGIPATGHSYDNGKITVQPTCGNTGVRTYTCKNCGDTYKQGINSTGDHKYTSKITKNATCNADGEKTYTCSGCGKSYTEKIAATGNHTYNSGKVTTQPTCEKTGVKTFTCSTCGKTRTESVPATGHSWKTKTTHHDAVMGTRNKTVKYYYQENWIVINDRQYNTDYIRKTGLPQRTLLAKVRMPMVNGEPDTSQKEILYKWEEQYNGKRYCEWDHPLAFLEWVGAKYDVAIGSSYYDIVDYIVEEVVGTEQYVVKPAYDETITTCERCNAHK